MNLRATATNGLSVLGSLSQYHPVIIEGMGSYDPRDPTVVARQISRQLQAHFSSQQQQQKQPTAQQLQPLLITQGDPLEERGISAITRRIAQEFGWNRGLVCLDPEIADYHSRDADRENVILECKYSELVHVLNTNMPGIVEKLEERVDSLLKEKNQKRREIGKKPLADYFLHFALLQEVTKAACRQICGGVTVAHTASQISEFSVTSFYRVGLDLSLVRPEDMVKYDGEDDLDFDWLEKVRYADRT